MIGFQIYGLALISLLVLVTLVAVYRSGGIQPYTLTWLLTLVAAAAALANPDGMTTLAKSLGINRGADLLIYCSALGGLIGFFLLYLRMKRMQREITLLVRELALRGPVRQQPHP